MHERQAVTIVSVLLFSVMLTTESFAQIPQCNGLDATLIGTNDKDKIIGTSGDDVIVGLGGKDKINGMGGNDVICGGDGNDKLYGNSGNDVLIGGQGSDEFNGGHGIDTCDVTSEDKKAKNCETELKETVTSNNNDLQKQINDLQDQINNLIFGLVSWANIQGIPESLSDGDDDMLGSIKCDAEQILFFDGKSWVCKDALAYTQIDKTCNDDDRCMEHEVEDEPILNTDVLGELNCHIDEIAKWDGNEWMCSRDDISSTSPIFFHWSTGRGTEWLGVSTIFSNGLAIDRSALVMPEAGTISNLYANLGKSGDEMFPGIGESFTLNLVKNDVEETSLSCIMTDLMNSCSDSKHLVSVIEGDTIVLRMDASEFSNDAVIRSSVLLSIP